ncbi:hypothetical protein GCK72_015798 [Caenorhabditis remanei]|uniref:Uncharacterized protein n=1 Tax=Caenorhabditis remanei TaxID=31234 RepID=A0A6A5GY68_CAERE|nr:hypothetical protein GCK72_015798 [Caenorhabditis remanei]KAF1759333.1 hypothetical protein GCK72_015798 [Caenorhabditis remanei]
MNLLYLLLLFASIDFCRSKKCEDTSTRGTVAPSTVRPTRKPPVGNNAPKPVIRFDYPESTTVRATTVATGRPGGIYSTPKSATVNPLRVTVATVPPIKITRRVGSPGQVTVAKIVRGGARGIPILATVPTRITVHTKTTVPPIRITRRVGSPGKVTVVKLDRGGAKGIPILATVPTKVTVHSMVTVPPSTATTKTTISRITVPTTTTVRTTKKVPMGVNEKKKELQFYPI